MMENHLRILVVDDQSSVRELLKAVLESDGHEVEVAPEGESGVEKLADGFHDLVIMDIRMPGISGIEALGRMKKASPDCGVVMMTAYASVETAVEAMKLGAFDYITKPIDIDEVHSVVSRFADESSRVPEEKPPEIEPSSDIVGASVAIREVLELARRVATSDAAVLILGESGTGKELIAHEVHRASPREHKPFVAVNCSAIPGGLLESELFGHEKGAFTGAGRQKRGRFELAAGGTIFLDEIGDMSSELQAKLLRFLQDHTLQRVGGSVDITVDVRIVAATNRDLDAAVADGSFREDLYFRLNVVTIAIPPLRDRKEDIPLLVEHFLKKHAEKGRKPKRMSPKAMRVMMNYDWPGNVRELENAIHRAVVLSRGETVFPEQLPAKLQSVPDSEVDREKTGMTIREMERDIIIKTLAQTEGNRTHAAKILGISRRTLQNKIKEYEIES
jgi:two-component system response regulator HydG